MTFPYTTFDNISVGIESSGYADISGCDINGSGSGNGVNATINDSLGGLHLEGSTVSGAVYVEGCGKVEVLGNPALSSVELCAKNGSYPLRSWVLGNVVSGLIEVKSRTVGGSRSISVVRGNHSSGIKLAAYVDWNATPNNCYIEAEVDSNEVGGDGIGIQAGAWYGYPWGDPRPGTVSGSVTRNRVIGTDSGTGLDLALGYYHTWCGELTMTSSGNQISSFGTGIRVYGPDVTYTSDADEVTGCGTGVEASYGNLTMSSCVVTGNSGDGIKCVDLASGILGGSLVDACDIYGNGGYNLEVSGSVLPAAYNYWGTVDEDTLVSEISGPVSYSPWTDATHTGVYTSTYKRGVIAGAVHWSGEVKVVGDVLIPVGSSLTLDPGTTVKIWANASQWDTLGITEGKCDIIAEGLLNVDGGVADSVRFIGWKPLEVLPPAPGQWGSIAFVGSGADSGHVGYGSIVGGTSGIRVIDARPSFEFSRISVTSSHGVGMSYN